MEIKFYCTKCGIKLSVDDCQVIDEVQCPSCGCLVSVSKPKSQNQNISPQQLCLWFYYLNEQQQGPVDEKVAITLIKSEVIKRDTLVWTNGITEWREAGNTKLHCYFPIKQHFIDIEKAHFSFFDHRLIRNLHKLYKIWLDAIGKWEKMEASNLHLNFSNKIFRKITIIAFFAFIVLFSLLSHAPEISNPKGTNSYVIGISRQLRSFQTSVDPNDPEFGLKLILFEKQIQKSSDFSRCPRDYQKKFNACLDAYQSAGAMIYSGQNSQSDVAEYAQRLQYLGNDLHQCAIKYGAE
jgi:GYF domain 2